MTLVLLPGTSPPWGKFALSNPVYASLCQALASLCLTLPLHMPLPLHMSLPFLLHFTSRKGWHYISFSNFGNIVKIGRICDIMSIIVILVPLVRLDEDVTWLRKIWFGEVTGNSLVTLVCTFVKIGQRNDRIQENLVCRSERKLTVLTLILVLRLDKKVTGFRKIWLGEVLTGNQL